MGALNGKLFQTAGTALDTAYHRAMRERVATHLERFDERLRGWFDIAVTPSADGGLVVRFRDISGRKRASEALRDAEERNRFLADLLERSEQPFGIGYPDGGLGFVNPAFERLTGYTREELKSASWVATLTPAEWREA